MGVQILAPKLASELAKSINNESMTIQLLNEEKEIVNYTVESKDTTKSLVKLKLYFKDPKSISLEKVLFQIFIFFSIGFR